MSSSQFPASGAHPSNAFRPYAGQKFPSGHHPSDVFDPYAGPTPDYPYIPYHSPSPVRATVSARIDWLETPGAHVFTADVPGMKKGDLEVEIREGNVLEISGARSLGGAGSKEDTWHLMERGSGRFVRRFRLPEDAMLHRVTAAVVDSVLTVTVPKEKAVSKPTQVISIDISG